MLWWMFCLRLLVWLCWCGWLRIVCYVLIVVLLDWWCEWVGWWDCVVLLLYYGWVWCGLDLYSFFVCVLCLLFSDVVVVWWNLLWCVVMWLGDDYIMVNRFVNCVVLVRCDISGCYLLWFWLVGCSVCVGWFVCCCWVVWCFVMWLLWCGWDVFWLVLVWLKIWNWCYMLLLCWYCFWIWCCWVFWLLYWWMWWLLVFLVCLICCILVGWVWLWRSVL